jgi:hypothetical protein
MVARFPGDSDSRQGPEASPLRSFHTGSVLHPASYSLCAGEISLDVERLSCRPEDSPPSTVEVKGERFLPALIFQDVHADKLASLYITLFLLPHFISLRLSLPHFNPLCLILPHFTSLHLTLLRLTSLYLTSPHF